MLPVSLDLEKLHVTLVGNGPATARRLATLREGGARHLEIFAPEPTPALRAMVEDRALPRWPTADEVSYTDVLFIADAPQDVTDQLAAIARDHGTLVNSEDDLPNCDFHMPAIVRRGDLTLTVSTAGRAPGLARHVRQELEQSFGPEWAARLDRFAEARAEWKQRGLKLPELAQLADEFMTKELEERV